MGVAFALLGIFRFCNKKKNNLILFYTFRKIYNIDFEKLRCLIQIINQVQESGWGGGGLK